MKNLTSLQFAAAAGINALTAERWTGPVNAAIDAFGITDVHDVAAFIAQTGHESASFSALVESLNYSQGALKTVFGHRLTDYQISMLGRQPGEVSVPLSRQKQIANLVYGGRNGNNQPDDGWNFRGRGLIQITGRTNYFDCGKGLKTDLIASPDLLTQPHYAAMSAAWFYVTKGCLKFSGDIVKISRIINGGTNGLSDRQQRYSRALNALM